MGSTGRVIFLHWMAAMPSHGEFNMKLMIDNWPVMAFLAIVVTLMAVADMNWPAHMGEQNGLINVARLAAGL